MAPLSDQEQLESSWRALSGRVRKPGWSIIEICRAESCSVHGGRRSPGGEESLLVDIRESLNVSEAQLPRGQGFSVLIAEGLPGPADHTWIAIVKQANAPLPLFGMMAADLVALLRDSGALGGQRIFAILIARIRAWQEFMKRDRSGLLSAEEEIGLVGELMVLGDLLDCGMPAEAVIEAWAGPEDGLHDLLVGVGSVEIKTTTAAAGFLADIGSLEQLDDSVRKPLYVACVRLSQEIEGMTLPEHCEALLARIEESSGAAKLLSAKLLMAGYLESVRPHYARRFTLKELGYRLVDESSPRLTRANVPGAVHRARYLMDLDVIPESAKRFSQIVDSLGGA